MKRLFKLVFLVGVIGSSLMSCKHPPLARIGTMEFYSWREYYDYRLSKLNPPVVLIGKDKTFDSYGVTLLASDGEVLTIGDLVPVANNIGASRNIGDTIVYKTLFPKDQQ